VRATQSDDWPLSGEAKDPTLGFIAARIQRIGLRTLTPGQIYKLAHEFGEHFYGALAADTAHEVRSLLAPLDGYLAQLNEYLRQNQKHDITTDRYLNKAMVRLQQLAALVEDLSVYSSPAVSSFERVALASVAEAAIVMGFDHGTDDPASIDVKFNVPAVIALDMMQERLTRALANLISNACQAMPRGGVLKLSAHEDTHAGTIHITVADTGFGMTPKDIMKAMERFSSTRKSHGGTGLGLPIARRIVEHDHHGAFSIESEIGQGTQVVLVLPINNYVRAW
jgi:signal transduction histidine kinase